MVIENAPGGTRSYRTQSNRSGRTRGMLGSVWKLKKLSGIPWNSEERRNPSKRRKISDSGYRNVPEERGKRDVHLERGRIDWELNKLLQA